MISWELLYKAAKEQAQRREVGEGLELDATEGFKFGVLSGYSDEMLAILLECNESFGYVCGLLARLEAVKGKAYQGSWMRRGELGSVFPNVTRKFDRINVILASTAGADDPSSKENLTEQIGDLAVYAIKWLALRSVVAPKEFEKWVENVKTFKV